MIHYSKESNWTFTFLTKQNLTRFISLESQVRMNKMITNKFHKLMVPHYADIYRLFLLYENGGMWIDANSFFMDAFNWIEKLDLQAGLVNKIGEYPDYFGFTYAAYGGNKTKILDKSLKKQI